MAYQNVGTPRFYVNILEYLGAIGYTEIEDVYRTNPTSVKPAGSSSASIPVGIFREKSFAAFLGHSSGFLDVLGTGFSNDISVNANIFGNSINSLIEPEYEGFSIASFNGMDIANRNDIITFNVSIIGSIVIGTYYNMPHSPDLSLKLSYEYDGVKTTQAKNGATLSNAMYTKPADWWNGGAWQLGSVPNHRTGRRIWDLQFSYLSDSDIFPDNASTSFLSGDEQDDFDFNVLHDNDFFSAVWNKTLGNALPFIFQPDKNNSNPDQFAICKFVNDTLQYERIAHNIYNIRLKIQEVW